MARKVRRKRRSVGELLEGDRTGEFLERIQREQESSRLTIADLMDDEHLWKTGTKLLPAPSSAPAISGIRLQSTDMEWKLEIKVRSEWKIIKTWARTNYGGQFVEIDEEYLKKFL